MLIYVSESCPCAVSLPHSLSFAWASVHIHVHVYNFKLIPKKIYMIVFEISIPPSFLQMQLYGGVCDVAHTHNELRNAEQGFVSA